MMKQSPILFSRFRRQLINVSLIHAHFASNSTNKHRAHTHTQTLFTDQIFDSTIYPWLSSVSNVLHSLLHFRIDLLFIERINCTITFGVYFEFRSFYWLQFRIFHSTLNIQWPNFVELKFISLEVWSIVVKDSKPCVLCNYFSELFELRKISNLNERQFKSKSFRLKREHLQLQFQTCK